MDSPDSKQPASEKTQANTAAEDLRERLQKQKPRTWEEVTVDTTVRREMEKIELLSSSSHDFRERCRARYEEILTELNEAKRAIDEMPDDASDTEAHRPTGLACAGQSGVNAPSLDDRLEFWKRAYARASFVRGLSIAERLQQGWGNWDPCLADALMIGMLIHYFRPFKQRKRVNLDFGDEIPADFQALHGHLEVIRDKIVAHRDLDIETVSREWTDHNSLELRVEPDRFEYTTKVTALNVREVGEVIAILKHLIKSQERALDSLANRHIIPRWPMPPGQYRVRLDDSGEDWLEPL